MSAVRFIAAIVFGLLVLGLVVGLFGRQNALREQFILHPPADATDEQIVACANQLVERIKVLRPEYRLHYGKVMGTGDGAILVELASSKGSGDMIERLVRRSLVEFRLAMPAPDPPGEAPEGCEILNQIKRRFDTENFHNLIETPVPFYVRVKPEMVCTSFEKVDYFTTGSLAPQPNIDIHFHPEDAERFAQVTAAHSGERLAVVIDGEVAVAPQISDPITEGFARIGKQATRVEAKALADKLRIGALPFELTIEHVGQEAPAQAGPEDE